MATTAVETFIASLNTLQASSELTALIDKIGDGIMEATPVLANLNKYCKIPYDEGGESISWRIQHAKGNGQWYRGGQQKNLTTYERFKPLVLMRAFYRFSISYHRTDIIINQGNRWSNYIADCMENARQSTAIDMAMAIYGDGTTAADGTDISANQAVVGLEAAVSTDPTTGTYAQQTRSAATKWLNNQYLELTKMSTSLTTSLMKKFFKRCVHTSGPPTLIICPDVAYNRIFDLAKSENWYKVNPKAVDMGFPDNIELSGAPIISDKCLTGSADGGLLSDTRKRMYFLNMKTWDWKVDEDFTLDKALQAVDQDTWEQTLHFNGQLLLREPRSNGVIFWTND